jgi:hypothetical protein
MSLTFRFPYQVACIDTSVSVSLYIAYPQNVASKTRLSSQLSNQHSHFVNIH